MPFKNAFSIVELLVVVAIVAILSAVAIPAYSNYLVKAKVLELFTVAEAYKLRLIESNSDQGIEDNLDTPLIERVSVRTLNTHPKRFVIQVHGKMQGLGLVQPTNAAGALSIQLQGTETGGLITWTCTVAPGYNQYVPQNCQSNAMLDMA